MMMERLRNLLHRWRSLDELDKLGERELADLGLSRYELEELVTMSPEVPERMARMAAVFGLTVEDIRALRNEYLELLENCGHCEAVGQCRHMLDAGTAQPGNVGFCPNAAFYRAKAARPEG